MSGWTSVRVDRSGGRACVVTRDVDETEDVRDNGDGQSAEPVVDTAQVQAAADAHADAGDTDGPADTSGGGVPSWPAAPTPSVGPLWPQPTQPWAPPPTDGPPVRPCPSPQLCTACAGRGVIRTCTGTSATAGASPSTWWSWLPCGRCGGVGWVLSPAPVPPRPFPSWQPTIIC